MHALRAGLGSLILFFVTIINFTHLTPVYVICTYVEGSAKFSKTLAARRWNDSGTFCSIRWPNEIRPKPHYSISQRAQAYKCTTLSCCWLRCRDTRQGVIIKSWFTHDTPSNGHRVHRSVLVHTCAMDSWPDGIRMCKLNDGATCRPTHE